MSEFPVKMDMKPEIKGFFDPDTNTISYCVKDPLSNACALYDSVLDFDFSSGRTSKKSADGLIAYVQKKGLEVGWIVETHVHADHLSAAPYLQEHLGGKLGIGARVIEVQNIFGKISTKEPSFSATAASSMLCSKMAILIKSVTWRPLSWQRQVTRRPACAM